MHLVSRQVASRHTKGVKHWRAFKQPSEAVAHRRFAEELENGGVERVILE